jgi:hypothetical protein
VLGARQAGGEKPRFRTIQVFPKDRLAVHRQAPDASDRPHPAVLGGMIGCGGTPGGSPDAQHEAAGVRQPARQRGCVAARGARAAAGDAGGRFLRNSLPVGSGHLLSALRQGLNDGGYIEGRNALIEYRWSEDRDQLTALAADLVRRHCTVIIAGGNAAAAAAKTATAAIPIVFATGDDPIHVGLVPSLNQPGGNITGVYFYSGADLQSKQLGLLRELVRVLS